MAFLLFVAFAQFANYYLFNWDRAGMLIVGMVGLIIQRWRTNRQLERLTMMQFLIELKNGFE